MRKYKSDFLALPLGTVFGTFVVEIKHSFDLFVFEAVSRAAFCQFLVHFGCVILGICCVRLQMMEAVILDFKGPGG